ncbi:hypothetical protein HYH02_015273 [Chlamydomonas schloesseri]|uniref:Integrase zinc-binding domain-containing protein n=1 Tax=Chlamydomonas schloesseri TaxID=2026947 RepID=A0A835SBA5_9CHLO|nr:hypothetical protein HYH02_015273 [Chlamydomonas schloesseri]|eukprot:KAG2423804.1 hypothetical protein HYH02_015273 [Chlamydomonas schloesseri]
MEYLKTKKRAALVADVHSLAHLGVEKVYSALRVRYHWEGMKAQLNTLERKYRASCVRAEELVSHARNLEVFWGHKLKYSLGQFSTAVRAAVAVGSFARLLNTFAETPTAYNLEDPASIDLMIGKAAALVCRLQPSSYLGTAVRRLLRTTTVPTDHRDAITSRVPHYKDLLPASDHAIMEPFHLAIRHAVLAGAEVTRHLAYTAVRIVPKDGGDAGAEPPASAARVVTTAVVVPAAPTAANAA